MDVAGWLELMDFQRFLLGQTRLRLHRYRQAIACSVRPGDTVLDLGSGAGALAMFACRAGARRVYAIEQGPAIELAKPLARANGFADRIVFLNAASQDVDLPERADVLVTDTLGFWQPGGLGAIIDARKRLLKPGGVLIPESVTFCLAPAELPDAYRRFVDSWARKRQAIDPSAIRPFATNLCYPVRANARALLTRAAIMTRMASADMTHRALDLSGSLAVHRPGVLHGLCGWLETSLTGDIGLGNRPGATTTNYAQAFLPIERATAVRRGDRVDLRVESHDCTEWRWRVEIQRQTATGPIMLERFDHSTFLGMPIPPVALRNFSPVHEPALSARGDAERYLLGRIDGQTAVGELQLRLLERYPDLFESRQDAGAFVAAVLTRCGRSENGSD